MAMPDSFDVHSARIDTSGVIVQVNENWRRFAEQNGMRDPQHGIGVNYLDLCRKCLGERHSLTLQLEGLLARRTALVSWIYPCDAPHRKRWHQLIGVPRKNGALLAHADVTDLLGENDFEQGPVIETSLPALVPVAHDSSEYRARALEPRLSPRQAQVLLLVKEGKENSEIAEALGISVSAVKKQVAFLLRVFSVSRRYDLIRGLQHEVSSL